VRVELYADGIGGASAVRAEMVRATPSAGTSAGPVYRATVSAARPAADYTARVVPWFDGVAIPLEASSIRWQR
jgi:starch phosphorylase